MKYIHDYYEGIESSEIWRVPKSVPFDMSIFF